MTATSAINTKLLFLGSVGGLLLFSGLKGVQVSKAARDVINGQDPRKEQTTQTIDSSYNTSASASGSPSASIVSGYANPVSKSLKLGRVDEGVDFSGKGFVFALGDGVIVSTHAKGWPNGVYILLKQDDGRYSYYAEDIKPLVHARQRVKAGQKIGVATGGPNGIEIGWATSTPGLAQAHNSYTEGKRTQAGIHFAEILNAFGWNVPGVPSASSGGSRSLNYNQNLAAMLVPQSWRPGTAEWNALDALWTRESGWSNTAQNPSSGAYGIPQALPPTKLPKAGRPPSMGGQSDPTAQIRWGIRYIEGRYGKPSVAEAHENASGWY